MARLIWDDNSEKYGETGISNGVLFVKNSNGTYANGVAWNGLVGVTEKHSWEDPVSVYAVDAPSIDIYEQENFDLSLEAYTYPDEFLQCEGYAANPAPVNMHELLGTSETYELTATYDAVYDIYHITGTSDSSQHTYQMFNFIVNNFNMPYGMVPGKTYIFRMNSSQVNSNITFDIFYNTNPTSASWIGIRTGLAANTDYEITIPSTAIGFLARIRFYGTFAVDTYVSVDCQLKISNEVILAMQERKRFALCYKTLIGNDIEGIDFGYKLHIIYDCLALPSEEEYSTINNSVDITTFKWDVSTIPQNVSGLNPSPILILDSRKIPKTMMNYIEEYLFGTQNSDSVLLSIDDILNMMWSNYLITENRYRITFGGNRILV